MLPASSSSSQSSNEAPERPLPSTPFYSVEYPGYVQPSSIPLAIRNLGGQACLDAAFKRTASKPETLVELRLRPDNPFAHPIPGNVVGTNNILLKIVRRRKRRQGGDYGASGVVGEYKVEAVGVIPKTIRFRTMADYQFQPDVNDPVVQLRRAMDNMDVEALSRYRIPEEKEDYMTPINVPSTDDGALSNQPVCAMRSNLRLFPPPLFGRQGISQNYNFRMNPASIVTTTIDEETGEEKKRLINRMRWKGYGPVSIMFTDHTTPDKPSSAILETQNQVDQGILERLKELFAERPIWTRMALFNQFTSQEIRELARSKVLLSLSCYVFHDGPWRDTLVRFGYDPRKTVNARFYQRLYFRNVNHAITRPSVTTRRQDRVVANLQNRAVEQGNEREADMKRSHIFDGMTISKETAAFQLCDITDPALKEMIEDPNDLRETCHEHDGWYSSNALERIKTILRHKFFSLLEGHIATEEECAALLGPDETPTNLAATRRQKLRVGKHNMAKGSLRPEDAAAARLRAALEKNARPLQKQS